MEELEYTRAVSTHYGSGDLGDAIIRALRAAGKDPNALSPEDLAPVDQFHLGGKQATRELMGLAGLTPGLEVLDVGGGLGGSARTLAAESGCRVTVLDLTEEYCRVGEMLTWRTRLDERVSFRHGDATAMPFSDKSFDVVWTQHSSMNIADKEQLYAEAHRVLRPGGTLALHEIMAGPVQPIRFPVPWAGEPGISFLRSPGEIRELIGSAGFRELAWVDTIAESLGWWRARLATQDSPPPLGLHLLIGKHDGVGRSMLRNLEENRLAVVRAVFERV